MKRPGIRLAGILATALLATTALAEKADRNMPVNLEADRITIDDARKVHLFEGKVRLSQGSLLIEASRIVVAQDAAGFQRGTAEGSPARFRQKREGRDEFVSGEAERIEYDASSERIEFFGQAVVRSGLDEIRGAYIGYDAREERYFAEARSPQDGTGTRNGRVRATIQPRREAPPGEPAAAEPPPSLQRSDQLDAGRR
jgi:lipopolysaccharide export system protein LptA